eukprot:SAG31_NODE_3057_length_4736_cov_28.760190_8_plen_71_part_00
MRGIGPTKFSTCRYVLDINILSIAPSAIAIARASQTQCVRVRYAYRYMYFKICTPRGMARGIVARKHEAR